MNVDAPATGAPVTAGAVSRLDRRRRLLLVVAVAAAVLSTGGLVASVFVRSPAQVAADTRPPAASLLTAPVEKRVLKNTLVVRGRASPGLTVEVTPTAAQGAGQLIVTGLRGRVGQQVSPGEVLIEVSGRPLVALPGAVPAYRDLKPDDDGKDVAELQEALAQLGSGVDGDPPGHFGPGTKSALTTLYSRLGFDVPTTGGPGGKGDQQALDGAQAAVTAARRQVAGAQAALAKATPETAAEARTALKYAQQDLTRVEQDQQRLVSRTGPMLPLGEAVFVAVFPIRIAKLTAKVGDPVRSPLVTLEGGQLVVQSILQSGDEKLVKAGMRVRIDSELLGLTATGVAAAIGPLTVPPPVPADPPGTGTATNQPAGYPLSVTPDAPLPATWSGQDVRLTIEAAATPGEVLVVPLAAVSAGADGRTTVTAVDAAGAQRRVPVRAGVSGNGFVEVAPVDGGVLAAGDRVVTGQ